VADATAAFPLAGPQGKLYDAETVHQMALAELHGEFAEVVDTESILASLRAVS